MKNGGGHFAPELGGHFELESGGHFKLELGGQYHWNLQIASRLRGTRKPDIQKTTPTQVFCTGVSLLNLDVLHGSS